MQTNTGSRVLLIARTGTQSPPGGRRAALGRQRATPRRIVLIKDGQFVGAHPTPKVDGPPRRRRRHLAGASQ
jgi:hypothetical protein